MLDKRGFESGQIIGLFLSEELGRLQYSLAMINGLGMDTFYGYRRLPMLEVASLAVKAGLTMLLLSKFPMGRK
jgi:hypothetical protein